MKGSVKNVADNTGETRLAYRQKQELMNIERDRVNFFSNICVEKIVECLNERK